MIHVFLNICFHSYGSGQELKLKSSSIFSFLLGLQTMATLLSVPVLASLTDRSILRSPWPISPVICLLQKLLSALGISSGRALKAGALPFVCQRVHDLKFQRDESRICSTSVFYPSSVFPPL